MCSAGKPLKFSPSSGLLAKSYCFLGMKREKIAFKYKDGYPPSPPLPHLPPLPHPPMNISFLTAILFTRRYL